MTSVTPWGRSIQPRPNGQGQAATYRERAANLRTLADAEADPTLRQQLREITRQYDEIGNSAVLRRETLNGMQREVARRWMAGSQTADKVGRAAKNEKSTGS